MDSKTCTPEEERNLLGAVIYNEIAFERTRMITASSISSAGGRFRHRDDPAYPPPNASLVGRARDLDDIDEAIQFDKESCTWVSLGEGGEGRLKEIEEEIMGVLEENGKSQATTVARLLGKDYGNIHKRLSTLWTAGKIKKDVIKGKTFYFPTEAEKLTK
jgi:hypothetical protein